MKKLSLVIISILSLFMVGCTNYGQTTEAEEEVKGTSSEKMSMSDMPCHKMADGTEMGDCDK